MNRPQDGDDGLPPVTQSVEKLSIDNLPQRFDDAIRKGFSMSDWSQVVKMWRALIGEVSDLFGIPPIGRPGNFQQTAILDALQGLGDRFDRIAREERVAGRITRGNSISIQGLAMQLFVERVPGYQVLLGPRR